MDFQLVVTRGRSASPSLKLVDGTTTVGRQDDCQLRIASSQVSRRHCQLFEHKGFLLVKDLGSSNGTFVNGKKIAEQRVLEAGDELGIGPVKFRVEKTAPAALVPTAPPKPAGDTAIVDAIEIISDPPAATGEPVAHALEERSRCRIPTSRKPPSPSGMTTSSRSISTRRSPSPSTSPQPGPFPLPLPSTPPASGESSDSTPGGSPPLEDRGERPRRRCRGRFLDESRN